MLVKYISKNLSNIFQYRKKEQKSGLKNELSKGSYKEIHF